MKPSFAAFCSGNLPELFNDDSRARQGWCFFRHRTLELANVEAESLERGDCYLIG